MAAGPAEGNRDGEAQEPLRVESGPAGRSCLVIPPEGLGGLITALPSLEALAASGRRLEVLTAGAEVSLLALSAVAPRPLPRSASRSETRDAIAAAGCGEAVVLSAPPGAAALAWSARIARRWGYGGGLRSLFLNRRVRRPPVATRHAADDWRELLEAMDAAPRETIAPRLVLGPEHHEKAWERLDRARIKPDQRPLVGVYPGAQGGDSGRPWPRRSWEEVIRRLRRERPGVRFVILATTEDLWKAVRLYEETAKIHPVIGPDLRLDGLAAVLAELDLVIAGDSWMLQLAAAAGTRTVGLFARNPRRWAPRGEGHRALAKDHLWSISVDEVIAACESADL